MSKIVEVRASTHSRRVSGGFGRRWLGANTKRDRVVIRMIHDEGRGGWGEARHGQNPTAMAELTQRGLGSLLKGAADGHIGPPDNPAFVSRIRWSPARVISLRADEPVATTEQ